MGMDGLSNRFRDYNPGPFWQSRSRMVGGVGGNRLEIRLRDS